MKNIGIPQIQSIKEKLSDGQTRITFNYPEDWEEYHQKYQDQEAAFLKATDPILYEVDQVIQNVTKREDGIVDITLKMADKTIVSVEVKGKYGVQTVQIPKKARKRSFFGRFDKYRKHGKIRTFPA